MWTEETYCTLECSGSAPLERFYLYGEFEGDGRTLRVERRIRAETREAADEVVARIASGTIVFLRVEEM